MTLRERPDEGCAGRESAAPSATARGAGAPFFRYGEAETAYLKHRDAKLGAAIDQTFLDAFATAGSSHRGPVFVDVPMDAFVDTATGRPTRFSAPSSTRCAPSARTSSTTT